MGHPALIGTEALHAVSPTGRWSGSNSIKVIRPESFPKARISFLIAQQLARYSEGSQGILSSFQNTHSFLAWRSNKALGSSRDRRLRSWFASSIWWAVCEHEPPWIKFSDTKFLNVIMRSDIPNPRSTFGYRDKKVAIWRKCHCDDRRRMIFQDAARCSCTWVPKPDCVIPRCRGKAVAVRRECCCYHLIQMTFTRPQ